MTRLVGSIASVMLAWLGCLPAHADTTVFFENCQVYTLLDSGETSDTISSNGYVFTYTRDKLFTGGTGEPIGRPVYVEWPEGVEAQAVTTPPPGVTDYKARMTLQRVDGDVFDIVSFTVKILADTSGAGATLEIMPLVDGEDAFPDPVFFNVTGYFGQTFYYDTSPNPWGSTASLQGFDTYKISLYVDFAFVTLELNSPASDPQSCCLPDDACVDLIPDLCFVQGGTPLGSGTSCSCDPCAPPLGPPPAPDGRQTTAPLLASRSNPSGESIELAWDATSCPATDYNLIFGDLGEVAGYSPLGAECSMGTVGSHTWSGVAPGSLWFLVVGTDGVGTESSWGLDGASQERGGSVASATCGVTVKDLSATCP